MVRVPGPRDLGPKCIAPVGLAVLGLALLVLSGVNTAKAVSDDPDRGRVHDALVELGDKAVTHLDEVDGPVLVTSTAVVPGEALRLGHLGPEFTAVALDRAGIDVVVDKHLDNRFGPRRAQPERATAELRLVTGDPSPPPDGFRKVATVDPLTRDERAERRRLKAELDKLGVLDSFEAAREAIERDPKVRDLLDRYAAIGDEPPLTLLSRELRN
jgi:hypothetical protein